MSHEETLTGKAKKAKRSEERYKAGRKRKREEAPALPESHDEDFTAPPDGTEDTAATTSEPSTKSEKPPKKPKRDSEPADAVDNAKEDGVEKEPLAVASKTSRKRRKGKGSSSAAPVTGEDGAAGGTAESGVQDQPSGKQRFIVFIGNLPFNTTTESVNKHFASITPTSVRHLTDPATKKSKGYAFLEFAEYDRMKTCLKLFHHSMFDTGVGGEKGQRKINVELTAGGGGKGSQRKDKLKVKNGRLEEQRARRAEAELKHETRQKKKKGSGKEDAAAADAGAGVEGIHPARLAMLNNGR